MSIIECLKSLPGFSATSNQKLKNNTGNIEWANDYKLPTVQSITNTNLPEDLLSANCPLYAINDVNYIRAVNSTVDTGLASISGNSYIYSVPIGQKIYAASPDCSYIIQAKSNVFPGDAITINRFKLSTTGSIVDTKTTQLQLSSDYNDSSLIAAINNNGESVLITKYTNDYFDDQFIKSTVKNPSVAMTTRSLRGGGSVFLNNESIYKRSMSADLPSWMLLTTKPAGQLAGSSSLRLLDTSPDDKTAVFFYDNGYVNNVVQRYIVISEIANPVNSKVIYSSDANKIDFANVIWSADNKILFRESGAIKKISLM